MAENKLIQDYDNECKYWADRYNSLIIENEELKKSFSELEKSHNLLSCQIDQANEDYSEQVVKYNELQKKYDELEEKCQKIEFENSLNKAKLRTFEYCIEHIFGE